MIPSKSFRAMIFATNMAWHCGGIPYRINKDARTGLHTIETSFSKWRLLYIRFSFSLIFFYIFFVLYRILQRVSQDGEDTPITFLVQMGYIFWCYAMPVVLQINYLLYLREIPRFTQRYMNFFREFQKQYMYPDKKGPRCAKFVYTIFIIGLLINFQNYVIILKKPNRPHFLTSILPDPVATPFLLKLPILIIQAWVWVNTWAHVWSVIFHLYIYISCLVWTLNELDLKLPSPQTRRLVRCTLTFTRTLRSLHVLHRLWQQCFQSWFCPSHKWVTICVATLASYGVVKLSGPRSIVMGCMTWFALLYLWKLLGKFGELLQVSERVHRNWIHSPRCNKWLKRYLLSVPPFRVDISNFYHVRRTTVILTFYVVLDNTVNLLLF